VQALERGRGIYSEDLTSPTTIGDFAGSAALLIARPGSSLIVPLRAGERSIGTLHADSEQTAAFNESLLVPLQVLADHAAGAVQQAQLRAEADERMLQIRAAPACVRRRQYRR